MVLNAQSTPVITDRSTTAAQAGARILDGANTEASWFATHSTPIVHGVFGGMPLTVRGFTPATPPLMPFFIPVILVSSSGATVEWFTGDVYVGGKPY